MRIVKSVKKENSYNIEGLTFGHLQFLSRLVNNYNNQDYELCKELKKQFEVLQNEEFIPQTSDEWFQELGRAVAEECELMVGSKITHDLGIVWCDGKSISERGADVKQKIDYDNGEKWWFGI